MTDIRNADARLPHEGFVNGATVRDFLGGVSETTFWRLMKSGIVPPPDIRQGKIRLWDVGKLRAIGNKPASRRKARTQHISPAT